MAKSLTVYKASAGSGKTFTLAVEYITLLISNPDSYSRILAVTFTNKATEEMKMRIISQLYGISHNLSDSERYLEKVIEKSHLRREVIVERAQKALSLLLHHYSNFRVQTIDAFFQSVFRNLAHELGLHASLRVGLNDKQVEEAAVDNIINNLQEGNEVLTWIREYIEQNIHDDQSWNVIGDIKDFGISIFRDFYQQHSRELNAIMKDPRQMGQYIKLLRQLRDAKKNAITTKARELLDTIAGNGMDDPMLYPYGYRGGILIYIRKVAGGSFDGNPTSSRVQGCIDDDSKWVSKKNCSKETAEALKALASQTLCRQLADMEETRLREWTVYQSAVLTLQHLSQLRLLHAIENEVAETNRETGRFQLSNTQALLSSLMRHTDSPFVFEKIGAQLQHIMIDEFQDTSTLQWQNFKMLLLNCMAQADSHNLIVGDVKQSIYRWREGDWGLLNNIGDDRDLAGQTEIKTLGTNFRSQENVVAFNNAFFRIAVAHTADQLKEQGIGKSDQILKAYDDVIQEVQNTGGRGYVSVKLLPSADAKEGMLGEIVQTVDTLLQTGAKPTDICILVRTNKDIPIIAERFVNERPDIRLVSDEAFRLDASLAVNILVSAMHLLTHPDDILEKACLVHYYQVELLHNDGNLTHLLHADKLDSSLPEEYLAHATRLMSMPMTDLIDELYRIFNLQMLKGQSAYVCAFYDVVGQYLQDNIPDIDSFIDQWNDRLHENTIQSDEIDGIRIISIHKSKGLQFPHVILPYCNWTLERSSTLWCHGEYPKPFDLLPIVPVNFSRDKMQGTIYEADYREEHLQNTVDNMNLLYVAFTRAEESLHIIGTRMSKDGRRKYDAGAPETNRSQIIECALPEIAKALHAEYESDEDFQNPLCFSLGTLETPSRTGATKQPSANIFEQQAQPHTVRVETFSTPLNFRQSNASRDFISSEDEAPTQRVSYIKMGNILHHLFSTIETEADIAPQLRQLQLDGTIYDDEITADQLKRQLQEALSHPQAKDWFSGHWTLFNECTILEPAGATIVEHRPDRVMANGEEIIVVDFKFGKPRPEYALQVERYMRLLRAMGYSRVQGYLWYVLRNEIQPIIPPL
jgi:ATP-dependent exoDNAse (exonuclease V) beta subunit